MIYYHPNVYMDHPILEGNNSPIFFLDDTNLGFVTNQSPFSVILQRMSH